MSKEKCECFWICDSPSKREKGWACSASEDERKKMCALYIIAVKKGWIEPKEKLIEKVVRNVGLV